MARSFDYLRIFSYCRVRSNRFSILCIVLVQECSPDTTVRTRGIKFRCQNSRCGTEAYLPAVSYSFGEYPRCCCGAVMKKVYSEPQFLVMPKKEDLSAFTR